MEFSAAGMVGGTASRLGGGSFEEGEEGAVTGFFSRAFNHWAHDVAEKIKAYASSAYSGASRAYSTARDWFNTPKTYLLGAEYTAAEGGGLTGEAGFYFHQRGFFIDYGTYSASGFAGGLDFGFNVGLAWFDADPSVISGLGYVIGGNVAVVGYQQINNAHLDW
jgi:hypothetical protein